MARKRAKGWPEVAASMESSESIAYRRVRSVWVADIQIYCSSEGADMKYTVVLHQTEEGFSVGCPGLPGCWSQGATEGEALENIQSAIREYLAAVRDSVAGEDAREVEVAV